MCNTLRLTELDRTSFPEVRDLVLAAEKEAATTEPRQYPGYPLWPLLRLRPQRMASLQRTLVRRRSSPELGTVLPDRAALSRLLLFAHGITGEDHRGPVPSSGGLQALELYMVCFGGWLPAGLYHYQRLSHSMAQLADGSNREAWLDRVPSLTRITGGALLWVIVGDSQRLFHKYGTRSDRFLLLEAGHLMQNLCLLSAGLNLTTVPLGAFFESEITQEFSLPESDRVLYMGVCG
jgi:SagB-type dehydrogenase family enzyme